MTQSPSTDVVPIGATAADRTADPALRSENRRMAGLLAALIAIPVVLALALTGLWVRNTASSAGTYGQVARLATLGQQVTGLAQAMADERTDAATFIASGRPATGLVTLRRQYAVTNSRAAKVRRMVSQLGHGYPAQTQAGAAQALASIARLPALRRAEMQAQASPLAVITGYSAAISGLLPINDSIADLSGNPTLITSVRALGSLSRMINHASQQQAILGVALAEGRFAPGALPALISAQAQQANDMAAFNSSATPEESQALTQALAHPQARQAQAIEQRAIAAGAGNGALALGPQASQQWSAGMSYETGWMGQAEQQLSGWITARAQALQGGATRSATIVGVVALVVLALLLMAALWAVMSVARRQRQPEPAALEAAEPRLPLTASAVPAGFFWRNQPLLEQLLRLIDSSELHEDDPDRLARLFEMDHLVTRIWRNSDSALVLTGHEAPRPAEPLALVDVLRAAASEIEEYDRVILEVQQGVCVSGIAATDTVHLLAELLENATTFSSEATQVIVSAHTLVGGGSLITITDAGIGMSEEKLTLFNEQLASPSLADVAVIRHMGLFAVARLAARHHITVTLTMPPGGGTTAEVYIPAALISMDTEADGWRRRAGEAALAGSGEEADGVAELPFAVRRFTSDPEPFTSLELPDTPAGLESPEAFPALESDAPETVPLMLGAPVLSPAPDAPTDVAEPEAVDAEQVYGTPIFESIRSGFLHAFGRESLQPGEQPAKDSPAERPAKPPMPSGNGNGQAAATPPASPADGNGRAMAGPPASSGNGNGQAAARLPASPANGNGQAAAGPPAQGTQAPWGLPPHGTQPGQIRAAAAGQDSPQAATTDSAEALRSKLASFQAGSRRGRAVTQGNGSAKQPGQDG